MVNANNKSVVLHGLSVWQARKRQSITILPVDEVRRAFASLPDEKTITAWLKRHFPCLRQYTRIWDDYYLLERLPACKCYTFPQISTVEIPLN